MPYLQLSQLPDAPVYIYSKCQLLVLWWLMLVPTYMIYICLLCIRDDIDMRYKFPLEDYVELVLVGVWSLCAAIIAIIRK